MIKSKSKQVPPSSNPSVRNTKLLSVLCLQHIHVWLQSRMITTGTHLSQHSGRPAGLHSKHSQSLLMGKRTWSKTVPELFRNTHSTTGITPSRCAALLRQRNLSSYFLCANVRWLSLSCCSSMDIYIYIVSLWVFEKLVVNSSIHRQSKCKIDACHLMLTDGI